MIVDRLQNLFRYEDLHPNLDALVALGVGAEIPALTQGEREEAPGIVFLSVGVPQAAPAAPWRRVEGFELRVAESPETVEFRAPGAEGKPGGAGSFTLVPGLFALFLPDEEYRVTQAQPGARAATYRVSPVAPAAESSPWHRHKGTVELRTKRLVLRRFREGDAEAMYRNWCSDPQVTRTLKWETHANIDVTRRILNSWLTAYRSDRAYHWAIEENGELIGDIAAMRQSDFHSECEIGYCLSRRAWNRGVMTEALIRVTRFLFDEVGFHRVTLRHDLKNPASGRVMQKAGFRLEGVQRESLRRKDGTFADVPVYAALAQEWEGDKAENG